MTDHNINQLFVCLNFCLNKPECIYTFIQQFISHLWLYYYLVLGPVWKTNLILWRNSENSGSQTLNCHCKRGCCQTMTVNADIKDHCPHRKWSWTTKEVWPKGLFGLEEHLISISRQSDQKYTWITPLVCLLCVAEKEKWIQGWISKKGSRSRDNFKKRYSSSWGSKVPLNEVTS